MSIDERAEMNLTKWGWRCGAFSQRIREFLRGFARFRQRKDRSGKIIFPACKYFARMGSVIYVSERNKNSAPKGEITMLNEIRLPHFPWGIVEWPIGGKR